MPIDCKGEGHLKLNWMWLQLAEESDIRCFSLERWRRSRWHLNFEQNRCSCVSGQGLKYWP